MQYHDYRICEMTRNRIRDFFENAVGQRQAAHKRNLRAHSIARQPKIERVEGTQAATKVSIAVPMQLRDPEDFRRNHYEHHACAATSLQALAQACFHSENAPSLVNPPGQEVFANSRRMEVRLEYDMAMMMGQIVGILHQDVSRAPDFCIGKQASFEIVTAFINGIVTKIQTEYPGIQTWSPVKDVDYFAISNEAPEAAR